jgi:hypothetical protein
MEQNYVRLPASNRIYGIQVRRLNVLQLLLVEPILLQQPQSADVAIHVRKASL